MIFDLYDCKIHLSWQTIASVTFVVSYLFRFTCVQGSKMHLSCKSFVNIQSPFWLHMNKWDAAFFSFFYTYLSIGEQRNKWMITIKSKILVEILSWEYFILSIFEIFARFSFSFLVYRLFWLFDTLKRNINIWLIAINRFRLIVVYDLYRKKKPWEVYFESFWEYTVCT